MYTFCRIARTVRRSRGTGGREDERAEEEGRGGWDDGRGRWDDGETTIPLKRLAGLDGRGNRHAARKTYTELLLSVKFSSHAITQHHFLATCRTPPKNSNNNPQK